MDPLVGGWWVFGWSWSVFHNSLKWHESCTLPCSYKTPCYACASYLENMATGCRWSGEAKTKFKFVELQTPSVFECWGIIDFFFRYD